MTIKAFRKGETARRWKDDCEREEADPRNRYDVLHFIHAV